MIRAMLNGSIAVATVAAVVVGYGAAFSYHVIFTIKEPYEETEL